MKTKIATKTNQKSRIIFFSIALTYNLLLGIYPLLFVLEKDLNRSKCSVDAAEHVFSAYSQKIQIAPGPSTQKRETEETSVPPHYSLIRLYMRQGSDQSRLYGRLFCQIHRRDSICR